jgi:hypothetical protein
MLVLVTVALVLSGCDWMMVVDAEVTVQAAAQQTLTPWPQQLLLRHEVLESDSGPAGVHRIAVLCGPSTAPFVATWNYSRVNGCGEASPITAWLEPLDPAAGVPCGPTGGKGERVAADRVPPAGALSATARVFDGGGSCPREASVSLSIDAPPP